MGKHLPKNSKAKLAVAVLDGLSYAEAGRKFGVSRQTAFDVANGYFPKLFMLYEVQDYGINFNDINTIRAAWSKVKMY